MKPLHSLLVLALLSPAGAWADPSGLPGADLADPGVTAMPGRLKLDLKASEAAALAHSPNLKAARFDELSAGRQADSQESVLLPLLSVDGSAKYMDKVPSVALLPGKPPIEFGSHNNWSAGVNFSWTVWDWGALRGAWKSAQATAAARSEATRMTQRQVKLAVRAAYLQIRLACEQVHLVADSLSLAQDQLRDVEAKVKAGTSGRIDLASSRQETLDRRRTLREARASLANAIRDLSALTGTAAVGDPSLALDSDTAAHPPTGIEPASLVVEVEPVDAILTALGTWPGKIDAESQPLVRQWDAQAKAAHQMEKSAKAGLLPKVQVTARSSYDYPDQILPESIQQNVVGVSASMPLFDWGRAKRQSDAAKDQARAAEARRDQAQEDWRRDVAKASGDFQALKAEADLDRQASQQAAELAKLVRESYKSGRSSYLEADSADLKALQAQVQSARTAVQVLLQAAVLSSLTSD